MLERFVTFGKQKNGKVIEEEVGRSIWPPISAGIMTTFVMMMVFIILCSHYRLHGLGNIGDPPYSEESWRALRVFPLLMPVVGLFFLVRVWFRFGGKHERKSFFIAFCAFEAVAMTFCWVYHLILSFMPVF